MDKKDRYYVYGHYFKDNNQLFYVGKGTDNRLNTKTGRSESWGKITESKEWYALILEDNLTNNQALKVEKEIIENTLGLVNKIKPNIVTYFDLNKDFIYDESSFSCLSRSDDYLKRHKCGPIPRKHVGGLVFKKGKSKGYIFSHKKQVLVVHRLIYSLFNPNVCLDGLVIDHIDGNPFNNRIENLRAVSNQINSRNKSKFSNNTTGFTGVCWNTSRGKLRCRASYQSYNNKKICAYFTVEQHGLIPAFYLACKWRKEQIELLNLSGAGYTDRHGT